MAPPASAVQGGLRPWLTLSRPANVVTAWADVLAGSAVAMLAGSVASPDLALLLLSTTGLYAGGVVLNDVFDAPLDAVERPERPIPSGRISRTAAARLGAVLLLIGIAAAFAVNAFAGGIAAAVGLLAVGYDAWGKHQRLLGPLNMGLCRAGNLLLGMAAMPVIIGSHYFLGILPLAYIAAVTAISRGEVHGGSRAAGVTSMVLMGLIVIGFGWLLVQSAVTGFRLLPALPFLLPFVAIVFPAFVRGARRRDPDSIRRAVKTGVLFLILLDASVAAGFGGIGMGIATAALLPVSLGLARLFAVT